MKLDERRGGEGLPEGFAELSRQVYAEDPDWIPERREAVEAAFSASNPWFETGEALALCVPGVVRAAGFTAADAQIDGPPAAFFGYWESTGDAEAERAVMDRIVAWAAERGAEVLYGPINFSTYGSYRLRVFAEPGWPTFQGEPYSAPGYPAQIEALGFSEHLGYVTEVGEPPKGRQQQLHAAQRAFEAQGFRFESLTPEAWLGRLEELHTLVDQIFGENFAYTPLSWESFAAACGESFIAKSCPVASTIAYDADDNVAGFSMIVPNYGPVVCAGAGADRVEVSDLRYETHMPRLRECGPVVGLIKTVGVARAYRRQGLYATLLALGIERSGDLYAHWFGALMRDGNPSRKFGDGSQKLVARYALYRRSL